VAIIITSILKFTLILLPLD